MKKTGAPVAQHHLPCKEVTEAGRQEESKDCSLPGLPGVSLSLASNTKFITTLQPRSWLAGKEAARTGQAQTYRKEVQA